MSADAEKLRIVFAGGGTGGHFYPALNLARAFEKRWPCDVLFFGTPRGIEARKLPALNYRLELIPVTGFQRRLTGKNLLFPLRLWQSLRGSKKVLKDFKPHLVIGTGGYVMGPVLRNSIKMNLPVFIQEQNSYPGVTTRMLAADADKVYLTYSEALKYLPKNMRWEQQGNPIAGAGGKAENARARSMFGLKRDLPVLLVFGGSQGARTINQAIQALLEKQRLPSEIQILWQCGETDFDTFKTFVDGQDKYNVTLKPFIDDMWSAYRAADLAVCRAGAMSLSELMAAGLPALLVPLKFAAADHQTANAKALQEKGCARLLKDDDSLADNLGSQLAALLVDKKSLAEMRKNMQQYAQPDAAEKIVDSMAATLRETGRWPLPGKVA